MFKAVVQRAFAVVLAAVTLVACTTAAKQQSTSAHRSKSPQTAQPTPSNRDPDAQAPWLAAAQPAVDRSEPDRALALAFAKDGSIWLTERPGRVRVIRAGQLLADPAITISVVTANGYEDGLLGIAVEEPEGSTA